jgi:hypothetical protein
MRTPSPVGIRRCFLHILSVVVVIWGAAPPVRAEDPSPPSVDRAKVDMAIRKGAEWLEKHAWQPGADKVPTRSGELDWLTRQAVVVKAMGSSKPQTDNPEFIKWSEAIRLQAPRTTLEVALRAYAIKYASTSPVRQRNDLLSCACFLADNQAKDGSWGAGKAVDPSPEWMIHSEPPAPSGPQMGPRRYLLQKTKIPRRTWGEPGDGLQSALALLGWGVCMSSGLYPEPDSMSLAEKWLAAAQNEDGGWGSKRGEPSQLVLTAIGLAGMAASLSLQYHDPDRVTKDERVQKAARWLGANLKYDLVAEQHGPSRWFWLWCVNRAGEFTSVEWFGQVPWYKTGSDWLLASQHEDGSWGPVEDAEGRILDTCWAMMFLWRPRILIIDPPMPKR